MNRPSHQKLGIIIENEVLKKLKLLTNINFKQCTFLNKIDKKFREIQRDFGPHTDYRHPEGAFFQTSQTFGLGQTNWT